MAEVSLEVTGECKDLPEVIKRMELLITAFSKSYGAEDGRKFVDASKDKGLSFELQKNDDELGIQDENCFFEEILRITDISLKKRMVRINLQTNGYYTSAVVRFYENYLKFCGCIDAWGEADSDEWEDEDVL